MCGSGFTISMWVGHSRDFIIIKTNVYVHIHNVFVSNELISVTILFQNTDFPFRLSPLIFLSRDRSTFSPTIITLSASILHIPISFFFFLHNLLHFPFYIHHMPSNQILLLAMQSIQGTHISRAVYSMCDCSEHHKWELFSETFPNASNVNAAFKWQSISVRPHSICASRNRDYFHLKQARKIKYISK